MLRHEFQPGKLVAGLFLTATAVAFAGDAGGLWETPWFAVVPLVVGGLCLAGATAALTRGIRRRGGAEDGQR
ncbi:MULTISPECIES: hypothetical protein [Streptomyces]|uniref:Integral membrane protein n=1 Tax=Streptomyces flaveolus TaxID=67297 RepID=A0ABV3A4M3_9ACTN|nr:MULTISPECIES: hypothetical protein [Streptomyces]KMS93160.1 hypothetical protein ACZ91_01235 [Streptomyces regensis]KOG74245.1 hypothetical protein ADK77_06325 [Streptomyces antibioticus]MBG7700632.1 hypothetical protein [Streptomyces sp. MC1]